ncbi:hypothetical protein [Trinickia soli]|uniref:MARCKS-like protein n=1 Tax=Trinickia soli TaxID=380675 RepID=A0A2N7W887_9BURK|nr:hypothetical protein [Trinickia soli]PMS25617.1 hypothetical protein C0Z19_08580 [Trinickia soli]
MKADDSGGTLPGQTQDMPSGLEMPQAPGAASIEDATRSGAPATTPGTPPGTQNERKPFAQQQVRPRS